MQHPRTLLQHGIPSLRWIRLNSVHNVQQEQVPVRPPQRSLNPNDFLLFFL